MGCNAFVQLQEHDSEYEPLVLMQCLRSQRTAGHGVCDALVMWKVCHAGAPDPVQSGLVEPLASILRELSRGGGAAGINLDVITAQLDTLQRDYPFQVSCLPTSQRMTFIILRTVPSHYHNSILPDNTLIASRGYHHYLSTHLRKCPIQLFGGSSARYHT